jgi:thiosulfate dehydrogenase
MIKRFTSPLSPLLALAGLAGVGFLLNGSTLQHRTGEKQGGEDSVILIPAAATMVRAWDVPRNPLLDSSLNASSQGELIRRGFRLFTQTPDEAPRYAKNRLSCSNCHLNAGQRDLALPLVGVAHVFPEYNKRAGRQFTLEDRIVGCFMRSENATNQRQSNRKRSGLKSQARDYPGPHSEEVTALASYITWLSQGLSVEAKLPWRGHNVISPENRLPLNKLDPVRGKELFMTNCSACHGRDGQGVQIGDRRAGPLWGPYSWNDGAGAARIYTLAGFIRFAMPYLDPGSLTDEEAQQIAAFINSKSRPVYPLKDQDYRLTSIPPDAVYYLRSNPRKGN